MATRKATPEMPVSDDAVRMATGKTWQQWFAILDRARASSLVHRDIVKLLDSHGIGSWWQQTVTVGYERARGLRAKHETTKGFTVWISKTVNVPVDRLFAAWTDGRRRKSWLPDSFSLRRATPPKDLRISWHDGSDVNVTFVSKSDDRSSVHVEHAKLSDEAATEERKTYWRERLEALRHALEG
jgi:uncharacterized protein YndB with AHSA1/START domain